MRMRAEIGLQSLFGILEFALLEQSRECGELGCLGDKASWTRGEQEHSHNEAAKQRVSAETRERKKMRLCVEAAQEFPRRNFSPRMKNKLGSLPAFLQSNFPLHFQSPKTADPCESFPFSLL